MMRHAILVLLILAGAVPVAVNATTNGVSPRAQETTPAATDSTATAAAGVADATDEEEEDKGPTFAETVKGFTHLPGLFDLYLDPEENKVLLALTPDQFDEVFLCNISRTQGDGYFFDAGAMIEVGRAGYGMPIRFERVGKTVFFKHPNIYYRAEPDAAVHRAVERLSDSVLGTASIDAQPHPETGAVLIDPASLFVQDIAMIGSIFDQMDGVSYSMDSGMSHFGHLSNFPQNTEIDVVLTFTTSSPRLDVPTLPDSRSFQHVYHYSLSGLPDSDFRPRYADDRVGHFLTLQQDYTSALRPDAYERYVNRWHLEKAEPRFKLSKPKQPIVFWLENTIPVEYRDAVREGVLLWNDAFERIGFQEAIVVKQQPDDADWDPADVRYSTIRWMVQPGQAYAVGPSRTNPFTGQIYDADIRISADFIRYAYREFTELADPVTRRQAVGDSIATALGLAGHPLALCSLADGLASEAAYGWHLLNARAGGGGLTDDETQEYLRQLIIELVSHEVGHTLGLRHNFKASTARTLRQMHATPGDKGGPSGSVMDYNPVNLAPEGHEQGSYYMTRLGPYDYWAIEYAYRPLPNSGDSETKQLAQIASRGAQRELAYGTDEDAFADPRGIDPRASRWDLRDDPIAHYRDMMATSAELWSKVEGEFEKKGERYQDLARAFGWGFRPYTTGTLNVSRFVGGIYHHRDHIGDPDGRVPFVPVPAAKQREALALLTEHVLGPDAFAWSPQLLNKLAPERWQDFTWSQYYNVGRIEFPIHEIVLSLQRRPLDRFYHPLVLQRLLDGELRQEQGKAFTMAELFSTLRAAIWSEAVAGTSANSFRRNLQRVHLEHLERLVLDPPAGMPADARSLARADLVEIAGAIDAATPPAPQDAITVAHLAETKARIEAILAASVVVN